MVFSVLIVCGIIAAWLIKGTFSHRDNKDVFIGGTPVALEREVPDGLSLTIDGKVKQTYHLDSRSFRLLAKTRIRTGEITPEGEIMGAYIYTGVPVTYIMEGVAELKTKADAFDRPLDMVVVFTTFDGKTARFSYGELMMNTDIFPVTLAFHREPLKPSKRPDSYLKNKYKGDIVGLHLVCPREHDTSRFLDNVTRITLVQPEIPDDLLPKTEKGINCESSTFNCVEDGNLKPPSFEGVPFISISNWFRIGHGMGIKGDRLSSARGYHLQVFLKYNFPGCSPEDFFLFVGCDGYRSIFSGREIFSTDAGNSYMLIKTIDGEAVEADGFTMGAVTDFFVDRCVKNLTHIVYLK
ncbi:MAG: hypothetical protein QG657_84 [Acidobacteriota bacterium]|nr:hypothetical protein [Acidobacteriota bacterium]